MSEPLTIYRCDDVGCGAVQSDSGARWDAGPDESVCLHCGCSCSRLLVFLEEDVRPLYEAARNARTLGTWSSEERCEFFNTLDAFPSLEEWYA